MGDNVPQPTEDDSAKAKINPDGIGVSQDEADEIIMELNDMTDEEIEAQEDTSEK